MFASSETIYFFCKMKWTLFFSEKKIQGLTNKRDAFCATFWLYIIYLTKVVGIDFKFTVLTLYYQTIF